MERREDETPFPREPWQKLLADAADGPPETTDARIRAAARRDLAPRGLRWWLPASLAASFVLAVMIAPGAGIDVRPHPHIRLATITYLFDGAIRHRDNIGSDLVIRPGDVNLMAAGSGVVHSERTPETERAAGHRLHGIQSWIALPERDATMNALFEHHPHASLPAFKHEGAYLRLIAGAAFGYSSPARVFSPTFYIDAQAPAGALIALPPDYVERALYLVSGAISVNGTRREAGEMLIFVEAAAPEIVALEPCLPMLLGRDGVEQRGGRGRHGVTGGDSQAGHGGCSLESAAEVLCPRGGAKRLG